MTATPHADLLEQIDKARRELDDVAVSPPGTVDDEMFLARMLAALRVVSRKHLSADERLMVAGAKQVVIEKMFQRKAG